MAWLKSKRFWVGFAAGTIGGGWLLGKVGSTTGVNINVPRVGG